MDYTKGNDSQADKYTLCPGTDEEFAKWFKQDMNMIRIRVNLQYLRLPAILNNGIADLDEPVLNAISSYRMPVFCTYH